MKHRTLAALISIASLIAACDDPGPPSATPDRIVPADATVTVHEWPPPEMASSTTTAEPAPTASATASAEPTATASATASADPAPSASASAAPVVKGFAFPSPKSGILSTADADKIMKAGAQAKVRVIDPGKEPLAKLAYAATKGDSQSLHVDVEQKISAVVKGQTAPIVSPPQVLDVDVKTDDVDASTGALVTVVLKKMSLKPVDGIDQATLDELSKQLSGLNGYGLRERVSPFGDASDAKIQLPAGAPKGAETFVTTMNDVFRAMLPNLPEEAIGVGAKWQALSREDHGGASVMQLAEYTLKERSGTRATVGYSARQLAVGDSFKMPFAAPEGKTTQLMKFLSSTSGSVVVDTKEMAPIKGRSTQDSKVGIDLVTKGKAADADRLSTETSMKATISFARRGAAPATSDTAAPSSAPSSAPAPTATAPGK